VRTDPFPELDSKPAGRKKRSALEIVLTTIAAVIGLWAGSSITQYVGDRWRSASIDEKLTQVCSDQNKTLPQMVDKITRLDSTNIGPEKTYNYHYTLITIHSGQLDPTKLANALKPDILNGYRTNPGMQSFRDAGISVNYEYFDADGNHITDVEVGPKDLQ
jgi:hypothetical protein